VRKLSTLAVFLVVAGCGGKNDNALPISTQAVQRRDIVIDALRYRRGRADQRGGGQVQGGRPDREDARRDGHLGEAGRPARADRDARRAEPVRPGSRRALGVAVAARGGQCRQAPRDELFKGRIITAAEHETAQLDYANAQSALVAARTSLDINKQRLEDATVRAPVAGTIIEKTVSLGTVITSAPAPSAAGRRCSRWPTSARCGFRALFNETDIGQVQPGQSATVIVDAYPDRRFTGTVEKIEPQAVVQQNVTMFPCSSRCRTSRVCSSPE
jgi:multidrug resistance efflux pump